MENQQELMYKFQMFEQQMQQIQQQLQAIEQGIIDLSNLNLGLDDIVGSKDKETMSLIGKGIFAKTKLVSEELIVDVGGKNFVAKSVPETKEMIVEQIGKLKEAKEILTGDMEKLGMDFQEMIMEAQSKQEEGKHECCGGHDDCACEKGESCEEGNCEHSKEKKKE